MGMGGGGGGGDPYGGGSYGGGYGGGYAAEQPIMPTPAQTAFSAPPPQAGPPAPAPGK